MDSIHPLGLDTIDDKGQCDSCKNYWDHLWDAYNKAICAFKFTLQQILISEDLSHLNPLVEKFDEDSLLGITFAESPSPDGLCYYISLSGVAE